jgi:phosphate transport system permease protein
MSTQSTDVEATIGIQYATAFVLLMLTFTLNLFAVVFRSRLRARAK